MPQKDTSTMTTDHSLSQCMTLLVLPTMSSRSHHCRP